MEITKTVPVTIEVDDDNKRDCSGGCCFNVEGCYCARYDVTTINGRNDGCLAEFGTGEKPAVVPWEDSNIGDVVELEFGEGGKHCVKLHKGDGTPGDCGRCLCANSGLACPDIDGVVSVCASHPIEGNVYFAEVEE